MHAAAEAEVRVRGFVLLARRGEAVGIEEVRLFEHILGTEARAEAEVEGEEARAKIIKY